MTGYFIVFIDMSMDTTPTIREVPREMIDKVVEHRGWMARGSSTPDHGLNASLNELEADEDTPGSSTLRDFEEAANDGRVFLCLRC